MSTFSSILDRPGALLLLLAAFVLVIGQIASVLLFLHGKQSRRQTVRASLHMLIGFLFFVFILNSYDIVNFPQTQGASISSGGFPYSLPWLFYAILEALSALILILQFRAYLCRQTSMVTPAAIRHTVDLLPEGICVSADDGTVLLSNLKMDALCRELTGERLADAHKLLACLRTDGEDQGGSWLIHMPQGDVWLFSEGTISTEGSDYDRISAVNVTERYRITDELRKKNAHLLDIQRRMRQTADLSGEMFVRQEEVAARTALHNELGQVLLLGRHYLEHPECADAAMVALLTRQMNSFLLGESKASKPDAQDELQHAVRMAGSIGVTVEIKGETPEEGRQRSLLGAAIRECAANTVKHAEGDTLNVEISENASRILMTLTNNGKPPKNPIAESGGLLSLRREIESAGGQMTVNHMPAFSLTISFMKA